MSRTSIQCILPENALEDDANQFRKGCVWESDRLNYTFENTFATTRLLRDNNRVPITVPPGLSGKCLGSISSNLQDWILGYAVRSPYYHDGLDLGMALKIEINLGFKD